MSQSLNQEAKSRSATHSIPRLPQNTWVHYYSHHSLSHTLAPNSFSPPVQSIGSRTEIFTTFLSTPSAGPRLNYVVETIFHKSANWRWCSCSCC